MTEPFHRRFDEATPLDLFGVQIRVLMPKAALDGALSMFEDRNEPGAGPPLHVHRDAEEIFAILAGHYRFQCGDEVLDASPGDVVVVPRGMPHTYLNTGEGTGRLLVTMRPGGFEGFFEEVAAAALTVPDDIGAIAEIGARYGIEFLGPNPLVELP